MKHLLTFIIVSVVALAPLSADAVTLDRQYRFAGDHVADLLGHSVQFAGDVNHDGTPDIIAGAYTNRDDRPNYARVYSGSDASVLHTFVTNEVRDGFANSVAGAGDVNRDGYDDVIVGASSNGPTGRAIVYSGLDGSVLWQVAGTDSFAGCGETVTGVGDLNHDDYADFAVSSPFAVTPIEPFGRVQVFSGRDLSVLHEFRGVERFGWYGRGLCNAGDEDGDGTNDIAVSAFGENALAQDRGRVRLYSGADGEFIRDFEGPHSYCLFGLGNSLACVGDINGDGRADLGIGSRGASIGVASSGAVYVYSGLDGSELFFASGEDPGDQFGAAVGGGDIDGDGVIDLIIAGFEDDLYYSGGAVTVIRSSDGVVLAKIWGNSAGDLMGEGMSSELIDINGDGRGDFAVGLPYDNPTGLGSQGAVEVWGLDPTADAAGPAIIGAGFELYPNPSAGAITLRLPSPLHGPGAIEVFTAAGRRILAEAVPSAGESFKLNLSEQPPGAYFLRLADRNRVWTRRIIVR